MSRRVVTAAVVVTIAGLGAGAWWLSRRNATPTRAPVAKRAGATIARGAVGAAKAAKALRSPYRCARWNPSEDAGADEVLTAFDRQFSQTGASLRISGGDDALTVGFVSDTRGSSEATLAHLGLVRAEFERAGVELVVTLGGMARDQAAIEAALAALARGAQWPVVAIPGGRENLVAHQAAVNALADAGRSVVFDGASVRVVHMDGATIGTIPGVSQAAQLLAGNDGCVHGVSSLVEFGQHLATHPEPRVVASYAPPRQRGAGASDLAGGGIHIGEAAVAEAVAAAQPAVVVHGLVDEAALDVHPMRRAAALPLIAAAGSAEGLPLWLPNGQMTGGSALIVRIKGRRVDYQRVSLPVGVH